MIEKRIQLKQPMEIQNIPVNLISLLNNTNEASRNMLVLVKELRKFWERDDILEDTDYFKDGKIKVNLIDKDNELIANQELEVDINELLDLLKDKIENVIKQFFIALELAFNNEHITEKKDYIKEIAIFLAGNSSKSPIVKEIFQSNLENFKNKINDYNIEIKLHQPLENSKNNPDKPTGKTGVAFGLIKSKNGGSILTINKDKKDGELKDRFKFYIGTQTRKKFKVLINKDDEYNIWIKAKPAISNTFDLYYSDSIKVVDNKCSINDESIKKELLDVETSEDEKYICLRIVSPTKVEYGIFSVDDDCIDEDTLVGNITTIDLSE